ncbi:hypothetical protein [Nonomuraea sp. NPDC005650]|uniref:hypothetical protein n=1 Tax=Nonomuraea sp. NPDC005650 TaxID=3157045 RepID=UPI0033BA29E9
MTPRPSDQVENLVDPDITPAIASHVLFHFHRGGVPGPLFFRRLLLAIEVANADQRAAIALSFPGWVKAFEIAADRHGGSSSRLVRLSRMEGRR